MPEQQSWLVTHCRVVTRQAVFIAESPEDAERQAIERDRDESDWEGWTTFDGEAGTFSVMRLPDTKDSNA